MLYRRSFSLLRRLGLVAGSAGLLAPTLGAQETSESPFLLDPFVVTGTRTERLISEAPIKTELIVPQDMRAYNVTTFKDALKLVPTARFENECQNCGLNQIQLLGLGTNYTSVLFDGAPLYAGLAKVYGADMFPAIFIDCIEVVKGGASVLYGPEAMAGVVNLISEEPVATNLRVTGSLESLVGDALEWEGTFDANYVDPDGRFSATLYGFHQDREGLDLTTDGFTDLSEFKNTVIGTQGWWHPLPGATLKVTLQ
ncbi:MAG: TonB-dependent receptor plug domain-containing protein, partial [Opitutales bacterium]